MRIIHVIDSMDPAQGGPPTVVARLAAAQASLGHKVLIVCYETIGKSEEVNSSLAAIPCFNLVTVVALPEGGAVNRLTGFSSQKFFSSYLRESDILHIHGLWRPLLYGAAKVALHNNIKFVIAPHGMFAIWSLQQKKFKKWVALLFGWRKVLNCCAFLHVLNEDEVQQVRRMGLKCQMKIIPNGVFPEEIENLPPPQIFYKNYPVIHNRPYILFLGRLHYMKGLDYLGEAFKKFTLNNIDVDLVVAGPDGGMKEQFSKQIEQLGLTKRVHLVGPLYGTMKYAAMVDALCFCQPSRHEGFSMSIIEAMGCGLPVVISKYCHFPEVAEVGAGEVVELNVDEISSALVKVISNAEHMINMGRNGRKLILSNFTWDVIAKNSITAYHS